jgi:uncharacterized protein YndB with AHSA1/START domain
MKKQIGKTKDVGFQFGIRKTIPVSSEKVWEFLFSEKGLKIWLGNLKSELKLNTQFETENGVNGLFRVLKPNSHFRMRWKPKHWKNRSTVQIRVIPNTEKTTIAIHQENLLDYEQREEMRKYWGLVMNQLVHELELSQ